MTMSDKTYDKRLVARNIRKGVLSRDEYQRHLDALPDRAENLVRLGDVEEEDDDSVDDEEEGDED